MSVFTRFTHVERVREMKEGVMVGIIVYPDDGLPVTVWFEKKWGCKIKPIEENEVRPDGFNAGASSDVSEWLKSIAKRRALAIASDREKRRKLKRSQQN